MRRLVVLATAVWSGCAGSGNTTWHADVRPIAEAQCVTCHSEGGVTPFSMEYDPADWSDGAPAWAEAAVAAVEAGTMPPWQPGEGCYDLKDERVLTPEEKKVFSRWASNGYAEGSPSSYRAPETAAQVAPVLEREADLVLRAPSPYTPDTRRPDDYRCFVVDPDVAEDMWISAVTVEPDQVSMVHHVILFRLPPDEANIATELDAADEAEGYTCFGSPGTWNVDTVAGWAPGQLPEVYPEGVARPVPQGSALVMQIHYNTLNLDPNNVPADQSAVKLWEYEDPAGPDEEIFSYPFADGGLFLPAGDPNVVVEEQLNLNRLESLLPNGVQALGVFPHMHQLGKRIRLDKLNTDGTEECVLRVHDWDFNWQGTYFFPEDALLTSEGADALRLRCVYDNSPENQPVVNGEQLPPRDVRWGDGTLDEMCLMYLYLKLPPGLADAFF